jgi:hypothetical protein
MGTTTMENKQQQQGVELLVIMAMGVVASMKKYL